MKLIKVSYQFFVENFRHIASFLTVGAVSAVVNFGVFTICWKLLVLPYQFSVSIAYVLSVLCHFLGNRTITFRSRDSRYIYQIAKYLTMVLTNYLITITIVRFCVEQLQLSPYIGIVMSIATTVWTGFFMSKYWVFQRAPHREVN